jgi:hypothetical protein
MYNLKEVTEKLNLTKSRVFQLRRKGVFTDIKCEDGDYFVKSEIDSYKGRRMKRTPLKNAYSSGEITYIGKICNKCSTSIRYTCNSSCKNCSDIKGVEKLNTAEVMAPYRTKEKTAKYRKTYRATGKPQTFPANSKEAKMSSYYKHKPKLIFKKYGLTEENHLELIKNQNGCCAICKQIPCKKGLVIDHDHSTGEIRGLLCNKCNMGLGAFNDDISSFNNAIKYLGGLV